MADSETFISLEECRGHKRGSYGDKSWVFLLLFISVFVIVLVLRASLLRLGHCSYTNACVCCRLMSNLIVQMDGWNEAFQKDVFSCFEIL
jgi:type III secretory pathway component EscR